MSERIFLAVREDGRPYIEDSSATVARAIARELPISFYAIELSENNVPSLSAKVDLSSAPRVLVARTEQVTLTDGQSDLGTAEIEQRLED